MKSKNKIGHLFRLSIVIVVFPTTLNEEVLTARGPFGDPTSGRVNLKVHIHNI